MATVKDRIDKWAITELRWEDQINYDVLVGWYNKGLRIFQKYLLEYASWLLNTSVRFSNIIKGQDEGISDSHLIAYRMSKEEILYNWINYLLLIIKQYFLNNGIYVNDNYFEYKFPEQLWVNLRNAIINLRQLPVWINKSISSTVFSGKKNYKTSR